MTGRKRKSTTPLPALARKTSEDMIARCLDSASGHPRDALEFMCIFIGNLIADAATRLQEKLPAAESAIDDLIESASRRAHRYYDEQHTPGADA